MLEFVEGLSSVRRGLHGVFVAFQELIKNPSHKLFVIHQQHAQRADDAGSGVKFLGRWWSDDDRQGKNERRALPGLGLDVDGALVPLENAVDHRQAKAGATFALGGEERFETTGAHLLGHTRPGIGHLEDDARVVGSGS